MFHKCLNEMLEISERAPSFQPDIENVEENIEDLLVRVNWEMDRIKWSHVEIEIEHVIGIRQFLHRWQKQIAFARRSHDNNAWEGEYTKQLHEAVYYFNEWNGSAGIYYNYEKNIVWTMNFISDEDYKRYQKENRLFEIYGETETDPDIEISLNELLGKVQYEYVRKKRFYNNKR